MTSPTFPLHALGHAAPPLRFRKGHGTTTGGCRWGMGGLGLPIVTFITNENIRMSHVKQVTK
jgi:hypothetical protein